MSLFRRRRATEIVKGQMRRALSSVFAVQSTGKGVEFQGLMGAFRIQFLVCAIILTVVLGGCRTAVPEESFSNPFDAQKVARLSHEAYKVAWDARFWAGHDLRFAVRPTVVDYEALYYLSEISRRVGWIARKVEKNPASPRVASKDSYDNVAFDVSMFRLRYQPESFLPSTDAKVKYLVSLLDQIAPYYAQHGQSESSNDGSIKRAAR